MEKVKKPVVEKVEIVKEKEEEPKPYVHPFANHCLLSKLTKELWDMYRVDILECQIHTITILNLFHGLGLIC